MTQHLHDPNIQEAEAEIQVQSQPRTHSEALCQQVKRKQDQYVRYPGFSRQKRSSAS